MTLKTFQNFISTLERVDELCSNFNNGMETLLGAPFTKDGFTSDNRCMMLFPLEAIQTLFVDALVNEFGESQEGAEWFVYEGIEQIKNNGTKVNDVEIKTFEEYYNFLLGLNK